MRRTLPLLACLWACSRIGFDGTPPELEGDGDDGGSTAPLASVVPPNGALLNGTTPIRVSFTAAMQSSSLVLGGDLGAEAQAVWSSDVRADDTVTLTPATAWPEGVDRSLQLDALDLEGRAVGTLSLAYTIDVTPPGAASTPASGSPLGATQAITLSFDEPVQTSLLELSGSLAPIASLDCSDDESCVVQPITSWPGGAVSLGLVVNDLAGNPYAGAPFGFDVDTTPPTGVAEPPTGAFLRRTDPVVIHFDQPVDQASVTVGGTLGPDVGSAVVTGGDTLTITPASAWSADGSLVVEVADLVGNQMTPMTLDYVVVFMAPRLVIPVHVWHMSDDDGQNPVVITPQQVKLWVDELNATYASADLFFSFTADALGPDWTYEQNTTVNELMIGDPQADKDVAIAMVAAHPDKYNLIFRKGTNATPGGFSCATCPFIVMPGFNATFDDCGVQAFWLLDIITGFYSGLPRLRKAGYANNGTAASALNGAGDDPVAAFDGDFMSDTPPDPSITPTLCNDPVDSVTLSGIEIPLPRSNALTEYTPASYPKEISVMQGYRARQAFLHKTDRPMKLLLLGEMLDAIEGEGLVAVASSSGNAPTTEAGLTASFWSVWSGDAQLLWQSSPGGTLTLPLDLAQGVTEAGSYRVWALLTRAGNYGIYEFAVNGAVLGQLDLYIPGVALAEPKDLGVVELHAPCPAPPGGCAPNQLVITDVGKNAASTGRHIGIDFLLLERL